MGYYKWKPKAADFEKWEQQKNWLFEEVRKLENQYKVNIIINSKYNSIYFSYKGGDFRISTHHSWNENIPNQTNGYGYDLPKNNIITNSKQNIIKKAEKILTQ